MNSPTPRMMKAYRIMTEIVMINVAIALGLNCHHIQLLDKSAEKLISHALKQHFT